jgi:1-acylglycerone phosphate reductase
VSLSLGYSRILIQARKPFGVRVITGMIGMVDTQFDKNASDVILPKGSLYESIKEHVNSFANVQTTRMPSEQFARKLVDDVVDGKTGRVYRGTMSSISHWIQLLLPAWLFVGYASAVSDCLTL